MTELTNQLQALHSHTVVRVVDSILSQLQDLLDEGGLGKIKEVRVRSYYEGNMVASFQEFCKNVVTSARKAVPYQYTEPPFWRDISRQIPSHLYYLYTESKDNKSGLHPNTLGLIEKQGWPYVQGLNCSIRDILSGLKVGAASFLGF